MKSLEISSQNQADPMKFTRGGRKMGSVYIFTAVTILHDLPQDVVYM